MGEINKVFIGQEDLVRGVLLALLADGHVLIESVPGLGKTLLVRALGKVLGCAFNRIQFTPDLMPSDVTGSPIYDERLRDFRFRPGPVFAQLLLADEINRAPAKTHSALLEIMQEARVTVDGTAHPLEKPFLVMATQNPIESEGTYNLPEAQLDRFLFKLIADYPGVAEETNILRLHTKGQSPEGILADGLHTVTSPAEVIEAQRHCAGIFVDDRILDYITALVRKTREWPSFVLGASPRAGIAILRGARAAAALEGRAYAVPGRRPGGRPPRVAAPRHPDPRGRGRGPRPRRPPRRDDPLGGSPPALTRRRAALDWFASCGMSGGMLTA